MSVSFQVYTVCGHILLMWLIKSYVSNEMMCNEVNFCKLIFEKDADRLLRIWKMTVKHKISLFFFFPQNEIIKSNYFYSLWFIFFFWPFFLAMFIPLSESVQLIKHCRTFVFFSAITSICHTLRRSLASTSRVGGKITEDASTTQTSWTRLRINWLDDLSLRFLELTKNTSVLQGQDVFLPSSGNMCV